ncbi:hypothetical protein [Nannocystis sp.]|nr:hypothetical protein [Nannocystis sp.]
MATRVAPTAIGAHPRAQTALVTAFPTAFPTALPTALPTVN